MPELPEVQTIVSELERKIKGKKIKSVEVRAGKVAKPSPAVLKRQLPNKTIKKVERRAKLIVIDLVGDHNILIHLKMTGQLVYFPPLTKGRIKEGLPKVIISGGHPLPPPPPTTPNPSSGRRGIIGQGEGKITLPNKFTRIIFYFTDDSVLYFNDIRKFGWVRYATNAEKNQEKEKYGVEPFDQKYTFVYFKSVFKKYPKRKIKQLLMDQTLIAGVGNIYADESLFAAKIKPTRPAGSLQPKEIRNLYAAIPRILKFAIAKGGTSADNYVRTDGTKGKMMEYLKVYHKEGQKCLRCGGIIKKIHLAGRGTHYCPTCQK